MSEDVNLLDQYPERMPFIQAGCDADGCSKNANLKCTQPQGTILVDSNGCCSFYKEETK